MQPFIQPFFDPVTGTVTYVVFRSGHQECAVIDPVLDYDPKAGRTSTTNADKVIEFVRQHGLRVQWILETHAHADHPAAAQSSPAWLAWAANFDTAPTLMPMARLICRCVRPHAHFSRRTSFNLRMLIRGVGISASPAKREQANAAGEYMRNATARVKPGLRSGYVITCFGPVIAHSGIVIRHFGNL